MARNIMVRDVIVRNIIIVQSSHHTCSGTHPGRVRIIHLVYLHTAAPHSPRRGLAKSLIGYSK